MSQSKNRYEAERWLTTAEEDLRAAHSLNDSKNFSHACFMAQQSAEKALKALWFNNDTEPWGHSIQKLVREFPRADLLLDLESWVKNAVFLDKLYIPTRYPNGLPDLTPGQSYTVEDAQQAIEKAIFFLTETRKLIKGL
jgi:HEPN domain-containing protein